MEHNSAPPTSSPSGAAGRESLGTGSNLGRVSVNKDSDHLVQDGEADPDNLSDNFR